MSCTECGWVLTPVQRRGWVLSLSRVRARVKEKAFACFAGALCLSPTRDFFFSCTLQLGVHASCPPSPSPLFFPQPGSILWLGLGRRDSRGLEMLVAVASGSAQFPHTHTTSTMQAGYWAQRLSGVASTFSTCAGYTGTC
jgi:hypothetical protein